MPLALVTVGIAVILSLLRGGSLRRLSDGRLRWTWLLFVGVALQVTVDAAAGRELVGGGVAYAGVAASQIAVLVWVLANRWRPGMALVGLGLILNAVVIGANGAMPVDPEAMRHLGVEGLGVAPGKHELLTAGTRLPWLADIVPIAPIRTIVSVGDLVLALGVALLVHHLMSPGSRSHGVTPKFSEHSA